MNPNRENKREMTFDAHRQVGTDEQLNVKNHRRELKQNQELFCACNSSECAGICRETHLYRTRTANPKAAAKGAKSFKSWTDPPNQCPEAYTKDQKPQHYRA